MKYNFLVVADRGHMKAFQVERTPTRDVSLRLVETLELSEAGARYAERVTDQAGEFPSHSAFGSAHSTGERLSLNAENEMRLFRRIADALTKWLEQHKPETWAFAAPSEINGAILEGLSPLLRERLICNLREDLVNVPAKDLILHLSPSR